MTLDAGFHGKGASKEATSVDDSRSGKCVGRVAGLWRYPVKSMAAEALTEIDVSWH
jgi:hypothetical protein